MQTLEQSIRINKHTRYQDTGIEWLQELPAHWKIGKGKWLFVKQERPPRKGDDIVTCFRDGQVTLRNNRKTEGFTNALKEHGYQGIRKGDLVIHNMDAFAGAIGISDSDGKSTPVYSACTPRTENTVDPHYYAYFLRNLAKMGFIESLAKGIRERSTDFRFNDFGILLLPAPPKPEQTLIARFLDRKTTQIDKAIAQKEKLIELLKERRQILIHNAVTKGLNANAKMRDSEVEWIGEIPGHWELRRLKFVADEISRKVESKTSPFRYVGMENIESWTGLYLESDTVTEGLANYFHKGDILFGKLRPYLAKVFLAQEEGICSTEFLVYRTSSKVLNVFLEQIMLSYGFISTIDSSTYGSKMPRANSDFIGNQLVPVPSIDEQMMICDHIKGYNEKTTNAILKKLSEIEKLKEYKATLINSAVTGKIKVPDLETMD